MAEVIYPSPGFLATTCSSLSTIPASTQNGALALTMDTNMLYAYDAVRDIWVLIGPTTGTTITGGDMVTVTSGNVSVDLATVSGLRSTNPGNPSGQLQVRLEASIPTLQIDVSNQLGLKLDPAGSINKGASGVLVQLETSNPSLQISSNALGVKLDPAGAVVKSATGTAVAVDTTTVKIVSNKLTSLIPSAEATDLSLSQITSTAYVNMAGMTLTPVAGVYNVSFSGSFNSNTNGSNVWVCLFVGGVQVAHSERAVIPQFATTLSFASITLNLMTQAWATVNGSQAIEVKWKITGGGTASTGARSVNIFKVS